MIARCLRWSCALALLAASPAAAQEEGGKLLRLSVGSQKVLSAPGLTRIAVGNPSVADVKPLGADQVLVVARAEGRTTLLVWRGAKRASYRVEVGKKDPAEDVEEIRRLLGESPIRVRVRGERLVLEGHAETEEDQQRLKQVLEQFPAVVNRVELGPDSGRRAAETVNAALRGAGFRNLRAAAVGQTVFVEGSVDSEHDLKKLERALEATGEKVESLVEVGVQRMVLTEVQFVEVRRSAEDQVGVRLPTDVAGSVSAKAEVMRGARPAVSVGAQSASGWGLQALLNDGAARLLAQPRLVCASGERAEFLAGGEIPIPLVTESSFRVEYKSFGIKLAIRPTADRHGSIATEIEAEASEVDRSVGVATGGAVAVPGFRTRRVRTSVTLRHGETAVLSGIFEHDEQKNVSKVPLLGQIPVVGELFKTRVLTGAKRELLIFVTPRLVAPDSERMQSLLDDIEKEYRQARDEVKAGWLD